MIPHKEVHEILKHLGEAGTLFASSGDQGTAGLKCYQLILKLMSIIGSFEEKGECHCEEYETDETIVLEEAVEALADGHALYPPKHVYQICQALGVPFPRGLMRHWYSDWSDFKGMHMGQGNEGAVAIYALSLSSYVAEQLGVRDKARDCIGRGFQARAYAGEIRKLLVEQGRLANEPTSEL